MGHPIAKGHHVRCHRIVVIIWANGIIHIPIAFVKDDKHEEPGRTKYLFDLSITNRQLVLCYRSRWRIETFFRDCKQYFGLAACQAQMMPQVILHVRMVFLAYTLTRLLMTDSSVSMEQMQKHLRSLHCLYFQTKLQSWYT